MQYQTPLLGRFCVPLTGAGLVGAAGGYVVLFEIALVVFFAAIELGGGLDLGDDFAGKTLGAIELVLHGARGGLLLRVVKEDDRTVLLAVVGALAIELGGVVNV